MYQPPQAPSSIGGVLDNGIALFRATFVKAFSIALVTAVVTALAFAPFTAMIQRAALAGASSGVPQFSYLTLVASALGLIIGLFVFGAIATLNDAVVSGKSPAIGDALLFSLKRLPALVVAAFVALVAVCLGSVLLLVPGIYLSVILPFGVAATVVERRGPFSGLRRSFTLTTGHWWRTATILTVIAIILLVFYVLIGLITGAIAGLNLERIITRGTPWYVQFVIGPLFGAILQPLSYALLLSAFYDLQLRREGTDLAMRVAAA